MAGRTRLNPPGRLGAGHQCSPPFNCAASLDAAPPSRRARALDGVLLGSTFFDSNYGDVPVRVALRTGPVSRRLGTQQAIGLAGSSSGPAWVSAPDLATNMTCRSGGWGRTTWEAPAYIWNGPGHRGISSQPGRRRCVRIVSVRFPTSARTATSISCSTRATAALPRTNTRRTLSRSTGWSYSRLPVDPAA